MHKVYETLLFIFGRNVGSVVYEYYIIAMIPEWRKEHKKKFYNDSLGFKMEDFLEKAIAMINSWNIVRILDNECLAGDFPFHKAKSYAIYYFSKFPYLSPLLELMKKTFSIYYTLSLNETYETISDFHYCSCCKWNDMKIHSCLDYLSHRGRRIFSFSGHFTIIESRIPNNRNDLFRKWSLISYGLGTFYNDYKYDPFTDHVRVMAKRRYFLTQRGSDEYSVDWIITKYLPEGAPLTTECYRDI